MANEIKDTKIENMSKFGENLNYWGTSLTEENDMNLENFDDSCVWVHAAFSENDNCKTYGGICLIPKMVLRILVHKEVIQDYLAKDLEVKE
jgi:hypothetical protein